MKHSIFGIMLFAGLSAGLSAVDAYAQTDKFPSCVGSRWSVEHDAELIRSAGGAGLSSGEEASLGKAYTVNLIDLPSANLPQPPGKKPKQDANKAAFVRIAAPPSTATIQVSATDAIWIDLVQDGRMLRSIAFSGSHDCDSVHKSVRFSVEPSPFVVQISGTASSHAAIAITAVSP